MGVSGRLTGTRWTSCDLSATGLELQAAVLSLLLFCQYWCHSLFDEGQWSAARR